MEDEYQDIIDEVLEVANTMSRSEWRPGALTADTLRADIKALEDIAGKLRAMLSRAETEAP